MIQSLMTAATGMNAQQLTMDTISNNLSNVNTTGFKDQTAQFQDLIYQALREPGTRNVDGALSPAGIETGLGVKASATSRNFAEGPLTETDNPLDCAIQGDGMFQVTLPDGTIGYSRDGSFQLSSEGTITNASGYQISPQITVPQGAQNLTIATDGTISVTLPGQTTSTQIGKMELARFVNPGGLKSLGGNLFAETDASGTPIVSQPGQNGAGTVEQNYVEGSNVQVVQEMVNMITAQRAYEIISKAISSADEMLQTANNMKTA
jgi:flagellar basal-body rod protein FlgG